MLGLQSAINFALKSLISELGGSSFRSSAHLQGTREAGRALALAGHVVALAAVLAAALLRAVGPEEALRTELGAADAGIALGALALAAEGLADRVVQAVALHRAVPAVPARRAI